jgi:hypothetical protein
MENIEKTKPIYKIKNLCDLCFYVVNFLIAKNHRRHIYSAAGRAENYNVAAF